MPTGFADIPSQSADVLEAESGYTLAAQPAIDFQAAVMGGRWAEAISLLPQVGVPVGTTPSAQAIPEEPASSSSSLVLSARAKSSLSDGQPSQSSAEQARFLIAQQKYLELLEVGSQKKALAVLRNELAPVTKDPEALHTLSG